MTMLDADIKAQLAQYLELLEGDVVIKVSVGEMKFHGNAILSK